MSAGNVVQGIFRRPPVAGPAVAARTTSAVLSVIMLKRGGGKAGTLLLACLMLARALLNTPLGKVLELLIIRRFGVPGLLVSSVIRYYALPLVVVDLVVRVLSFYAFRQKLKVTSHA